MDVFSVIINMGDDDGCLKNCEQCFKASWFKKTHYSFLTMTPLNHCLNSKKCSLYNMLKLQWCEAHSDLCAAACSAGEATAPVGDASPRRAALTTRRTFFLSCSAESTHQLPGIEWQHNSTECLHYYFVLNPPLYG